MPAWIVSLAHTLQPWADLYNGSTAVSNTVTFLHLGGIFVAGGLALAADRSTLRVLRRPLADRREVLSELMAVHRPVLMGLTVVAISGVAMMASDVKTFLPSAVFWVKMGVVVLLLANGLTLLSAERRLQLDPEDEAPWRALRAGSLRSGALWLLAMLFGVILTSI